MIEHFPEQRGVAQTLLPKLLIELETLRSYDKGTVLLRARPLQTREICGKLCLYSMCEPEC